MYLKIDKREYLYSLLSIVLFWGNNLLLKLENVTFGYQKEGKPLLSGVNLELIPGGRIGIIGDNGSGKSTIAKLILGLHSPNQGSVKLFGQRACWGKHYPELGYIGDPSYNPGGLGLPMDISVKDLINSFKKLWFGSNQEQNFELEEQLAIQEFCKTDVAKLSKGQRMRVMAFLALAKRPKLLIADEATEGLDKDSREAVISAIKQASSNPNFGMIWISHRRHEVALLTNEVYELAEGQLNRSSINEFSCELETNSINNHQIYQNICKDEALEIIGEVFTSRKFSKFKFTGTRQN